MRYIALLFTLVFLACNDGQAPSEPPAGLCPQSAARCAVVAGTVLNAGGRPVVGASIMLIPDSGQPFIGGGRTDAAGHFRMEADMEHPSDRPPLEGIPVHLLAREESGGQALDASVPMTVVFAPQGTRPPVGIAHLVLQDPAEWPSTPSGRIVFVHSSDNATSELYLINADGTGQAPLHATGSIDLSPVWTPDGGAVLFSLEGQLSLIDPDGGNLRAFGQDLIGWKLRWAPDGQHLAYLSDFTDHNGMLHQMGLWVAQPDGSDPGRLPTQDDQLCLGECSRIGAFEWYPDAGRIGYTVVTPGPGGSNEGGNYTTRLSDSSIAPIGGPVRVWTKDASRAALLNNNLIEIADPNGTRLAAFPSGNEMAWSPDGQWLAYVALSSDQMSLDLWVADKNGERRRRIAQGASSPNWQP